MAFTQVRRAARSPGDGAPHTLPRSRRKRRAENPALGRCRPAPWRGAAPGRTLRAGRAGPIMSVCMVRCVGNSVGFLPRRRSLGWPRARGRRSAPAALGSHGDGIPAPPACFLGRCACELLFEDVRHVDRKQLIRSNHDQLSFATARQAVAPYGKITRRAVRKSRLSASSR